MLGGQGEDVMLMAAGGLVIRSEVILVWSVEGGAEFGARGEVFHFYISFMVVKWWPNIAEWYYIVP